MIQRLKPFNDDPYDRPNDDWQQVTIPGESSQPDRHVRVSSMRFNRKKFTYAVTAFVLGSIAILMLSPNRNEFLAPGALASNHAQILVGEGSDRCSACHDAGNKAFGEWLISAFKPGNNAQSCQSTLCMKCHDKTIDSQLARRPHNVAPEYLQSLSAEFVSTIGLPGLSPPVNRKGEIECSACHREHHGNDDLTAMTVQQCQSCHAEQYNSFETDHPEFSKWPQVRRQRIAFDHISHGYKHFPGQNTEFNCQVCHVDDRDQNVKLLTNYETACAKCHQQDIEGRGSAGMQLVALPMLDLDAVNDQQLSVGAWPTDASGDFDGEIPELTRILLHQDESARAVFAKRGADFSFGELDPDNAEDVADAVELAWAYKYLLFDLATKGKTELQDRLEFSFGRSLNDQELAVLTNGLDASVFARAVNRWIPALATEVPERRQDGTGESVAELFRAHEPLSYFLDDQPTNDILSENPLGKLMGVENQVRDQAINSPASNNHQPISALANPTSHNPASHNQEPNNASSNQSRNSISTPNIPENELLANNPIANLVGSMSAATTNATGQPETNSQSLQANNNPTQRPSQRPAQSQNLAQSSSLPAIANAPIAASELLATNPLPGLLGNQQAPNSNLIADRNNVDRTTESDNAIVEEFVEKVTDAIEEQPARGFSLEDAPSERLIASASGGGWFRNDQVFQISYRPAGHADRFLTTLSDAVAGVENAQSHPAVGSYFKQMHSNASVGACNLCHTTDVQANDTFQVNWQPQYRDPSIKPFTRFSHAPHLTQTELRDCKSCHTLDPEHSNASSFADFNSQNVISNFSPITKLQCANCHREGGAGNQCTECHNYHVGSRALLIE